MYALVTGASSGIGLRYARTLALVYHYNLLMISNQSAELEQSAREIHDESGVETLTLCMNLAAMDAADDVMKYVHDHQLEVDVLINNAGMLIFDPLVDVPVARVDTLLMLHVVTMTKLCRLIAPEMMERGRGYILNMSSMSAWMAMPYIQCYNASKAYVLSFSKSLWYELNPYHVHVLAMTPGSTDTGLLPFPPQWGKILRAVGITMSPERLVSRALKVLFHTSRKRCMPGAWNYIIVPIINHLPDWLVRFFMKILKIDARL